MSAAVVSYGFSADRGSEFMVWHEIRGLLTYTGRAPQQRLVLLVRASGGTMLPLLSMSRS